MYVFSGMTTGHWITNWYSLSWGSLLEALFQRGLLTWDGCVKPAAWRNCDHMLMFKQVARDSLGCLYLYSFNDLHKQFYSQLLLPKFLNNNNNNCHFLPCIYLLTFPNLLTNNHYYYYFDLSLYCQKHKQSSKLQRKFSN